jgi:BirA family biotin operon repressor/biotin-[acetyl-CoA-carboxylase] ligase
VTDALLDSLASRLDDPPDQVVAAWRERDALLGQPISWETGSGIAAGVDDRGSLLVDTPDGRVELDAGEVHLGSGSPG